MAQFEFAEVAILPDREKESLARGLLEEFGANISRIQRNGEMIHSCILPFGLHANGDKNPSASLNYKKLTYKCLGCGNGGGLLWFIGVMRGTGSEQAKKWLVEDAGVTVTAENLPALLKYLENVFSPRSLVRAPIPELAPAVLDQWRTPVLLDALTEFLWETRRVPQQAVHIFQLGLNMEAERIIIPHFWKGKLTGWQGRRLHTGITPKYKNTPDFPKDQTLYNYKGGREVGIIVESPLSVLVRSFQFDMAATFGASCTDSQVRLMRKHSKVILFFDNDEAGWNATRRVAEGINSEGKREGEGLLGYTTVYVANNAWNGDPADLKVDQLDYAIHEAVPYELWAPPKILEEV